ncbi:MAG: lamin tail domain-containing protein [Ignavibacteria bacterium]|nr:lamin tail domain-containing protein [Ignavibacteria bacterium]
MVPSHLTCATPRSRPIHAGRAPFAGLLLLLVAVPFMTLRGQGRLVINEILYAPLPGRPEWVELVNAGNAPLDVRGWMLRDATAPLPVISEQSLIIPVGGYLVVGKDSAVADDYGAGELAFCVMARMPSLNNTGDDLALLRPDSTLADAVLYKSSWGGADGRSLERINPLGAGSDAGNWASSDSPSLATPGARNSVAAREHDLAVARLTADGADIVVSVANRGLKEARDAELLLYRDRDLDSAGATDELRGRVAVPPLPPDDSLRVVFPGEASGPGDARVIAIVAYAPDERDENNRRILDVHNALARGSLAVNEILFDPLEGDAEWVEIVNTTTSPLDVRAFRIADAPGADGKRTYRSLSRASGPVPAGGYLVIASDSSLFARFPELASASPSRVHAVLSDGGLSLAGTEDEIVIADANGAVVDSLRYSSSWHHPNVASTKGRSLERLNDGFPATLPANWTTCADPRGGTPGARNSVYTRRPPLEAGGEASLSFAPNPFSPDGDGVDDACVVCYTLPWNVAQIRLRVFDTRGRLVRTVANNAPSGSTGQVLWDGRDDAGRRVRLGMYVMLLEACDARLVDTGAVKGVVVVASRL